MVDNTIKLTLRIPNQEIQYIYKNKILTWFEEKVRTRDLKQLYHAVLNKDVLTFEREVNVLLMDTISFMDSAENFYHRFLLGILSLMETHIVKSNRELSEGRSDMFLKRPFMEMNAVIIEIKIADKPRNLLSKCEEALQQIEDKHYARELEEEGYEDITILRHFNIF